MSAVATTHLALPGLIDRASQALLGARSSAEVLEAKDLANVAYTAAKLAARLGKAKSAHDEVIVAIHRAQADALEIEAGAKRRLADEYDAAQERGEVMGRSGGFHALADGEGIPTQKEIGINHHDIHEARKVRDAEKREPGIVRQSLDRQLAAGKEPTKAALRRDLMGDMPTTHEAEESWQNDIYDQACLLLKRMAEPTRHRFVAHIEETYP